MIQYVRTLGLSTIRPSIIDMTTQAIRSEVTGTVWKVLVEVFLVPGRFEVVSVPDRSFAGPEDRPGEIVIVVRRAAGYGEGAPAPK